MRTERPTITKIGGLWIGAANQAAVVSVESGGAPGAGRGQVGWRGDELSHQRCGIGQNRAVVR
jgi:hypothetical protein